MHAKVAHVKLAVEIIILEAFKISLCFYSKM